MAIDASDAVTSHSGPIFWFVGPRISEAKHLYMPPCWNFPYKMIELESRIKPKNYIYMYIYVFKKNRSCKPAFNKEAILSTCWRLGRRTFV